MSSVRLPLLSALIAALLTLTCTPGTAAGSPAVDRPSAQTVQSAPSARISWPAMTERSNVFIRRWLHAINVHHWRWVRRHSVSKRFRALRRYRDRWGPLFADGKSPCHAEPGTGHSEPRQRECYVNFGQADVMLRSNGTMTVTGWGIYQ